jgi:hypothetical protein
MPSLGYLMVNKLDSGPLGPAEAMIMPEPRHILQPRHLVALSLITLVREPANPLRLCSAPMPAWSGHITCRSWGVLTVGLSGDDRNGGL